jgi:hypothetical protein
VNTPNLYGGLRLSGHLSSVGITTAPRNGPMRLTEPCQTSASAPHTNRCTAPFDAYRMTAASGGSPDATGQSTGGHLREGGHSRSPWTSRRTGDGGPDRAMPRGGKRLPSRKRTASLR